MLRCKRSANSDAVSNFQRLLHKYPVSMAIFGRIFVEKENTSHQINQLTRKRFQNHRCDSRIQMTKMRNEMKRTIPAVNISPRASACMSITAVTRPVAIATIQKNKNIATLSPHDRAPGSSGEAGME